MCIKVIHLFLCVIIYFFVFRSKDDNANALEGSRFFIHANGSLEIHSVKGEDDGEYTCVTENSEGKLAITAKLEVKGEILDLFIILCRFNFIPNFGTNN